MRIQESLRKLTPYEWPSYSRKDKIRLDMNESSWGCSPEVLKAIRTLGPEDISAYPDYGPAVENIARLHRLEPENVLLTNGADEAIHTILNTFIRKDEEVVIPVPTFSLYRLEAQVREARIVEVPYDTKDFSFPLRTLLQKIGKRTRLLILINPNNPTGTLIGRKNLEKILFRARRSLVLLDETYAPFVPVTQSGLLKRFSHLILIGSFSKFHGLAGLRLGYILAAKKIISLLRKVMQPCSVNALALAAGKAAVDDFRFQQKVRAGVLAEKRFLQRELRKMGFKVFPGAANFLLARTEGSCDNVCEGLFASRILVKNLNHEPLLKGCLRLTVGRPEQNRLLLEKIHELLPPQAVLFDLDGVLVDVSRSYRTAIKKTAEFFLNETISLSEIDARKLQTGYNNDWDVTAALIASRNKRVSRRKIISVFQGLYFGKKGEGLISQERWLLPKNILLKLAKKYRLGIVTGRPRKEALFTLRKFGVEKFFSGVVSMEDVGRKPKPHPFGLRLALKRMNVRRAVYVGDIPDDMAAARAAGVTAIAVCRERIKKKALWKSRLKEAGARHIIPTVSSLTEVLE
ncbi:MAG: histidinol-phosphate transaminase [Candidatus Aminicenantales bacterium]